MGIITKGMGAILKKGSKKFSDLEKKGYKKITVKRLTPQKGGKDKAMTRLVGPLKGFNTKPKMPVRKGQGVLFREKYETMPKGGELPGQLKFNFKRKAITGRYNIKKQKLND